MKKCIISAFVLLHFTGIAQCQSVVSIDFKNLISELTQNKAYALADKYIKMGKNKRGFISVEQVFSEGAKSNISYIEYNNDVDNKQLLGFVFERPLLIKLAKFHKKHEFKKYQIKKGTQYYIAYFTTQPFVGEITLTKFRGYIPTNWMFCPIKNIDKNLPAIEASELPIELSELLKLSRLFKNQSYGVWNKYFSIYSFTVSVYSSFAERNIEKGQGVDFALMGKLNKFVNKSLSIRSIDYSLHNSYMDNLPNTRYKLVIDCIIPSGDIETTKAVEKAIKEYTFCEVSRKTGKVLRRKGFVEVKDAEGRKRKVEIEFTFEKNMESMEKKLPINRLIIDISSIEIEKGLKGKVWESLKNCKLD